MIKKQKKLTNTKEKHIKTCKKNDYAHIEVVVTLVVVNFFGFLVIAPYPTSRFLRKLVEIFVQASRIFLNRSGPSYTSGNPSC